MKRCMILITSEYPFSSGETFLESEIWFSKDYFDKIIILSIDLNPDVKKTRDVPENVDFYNVSNKNKKFSRAGDVLCGAVNLLNKTPLYQYDKELIGGNFKRAMFYEYFCSRSKREFNLCMDKLSAYDFSEYDSITVYSYWFFVTAMIGTMIKSELFKNNKNVKLISRAHRYDLYNDKNSLNYLPLRKYLLENVDKVYPCSLDGEKYLKTGYPEFADKIKCSYLGTFDKGISKPSSSGLNIVSCSKLSPWKRVDMIANAVSLCSDVPNLSWTHIGDGEKMSEIKKIKEEKLGSIKAYLKGSMSNAEVYNYYTGNEVDIFINVSSSEGLPVSIMEAMSFSIPVIATDVGGTAEIVKDNYNGWLIKPDFTVEELAEKIRSISKMDKPSIDIMRKNARTFWKENFDAQKNYSDFSKIISSPKNQL